MSIFTNPSLLLGLVPYLTLVYDLAAVEFEVAEGVGLCVTTLREDYKERQKQVP